MLADLIPELLEEVLHYLQPNDIKKLMCLDKAHHKALQPVVFQTINVSYKQILKEDSLEGVNWNLFKYAHTLSFKDCSSLKPVAGDKRKVDIATITKNIEEVLQHSNPVVLFLYSCNVTAELFSTIGKLSNLAELNMINGTTSDYDVLIICEHLSQLIKLKIDGSRAVTDRGLQSIGNLSALQVLYVGGSSITDVSLEKISSLVGLRELDVSFCNGLSMKGFCFLSSVPLLTLKMAGLADGDLDGISSVAMISTLRSLDIGSNRLGELVLHLAALHELRVLDVSNCVIGDSGMQYIAKLNLLEKLILSENPITEHGLGQLIELEHLREVDVGNCWGITYWMNNPVLQKIRFRLLNLPRCMK